MLHAAAGEDGRKAAMLGFVVLCVVGAAVLVSAPASVSVSGDTWGEPVTAGLVPILAGLFVGGGFFGWRRFKFSKRWRALTRALAAAGEDAARPAYHGLGSYYDTHLILLRCQYEYLLARYGKRAPRSTALFEDSFGFTADDGFECGPLNVAPDTARMLRLRERWEARIAAAQQVAGSKMPALSLREDRAYRVFPREMTVPMELATRSAYLSISCRMLRERYGKDEVSVPEPLRQRAARDRREYQKITRR